MEKLIILVDMDNTIVDYSTPIADAIKTEGQVDADATNWFTFTDQKPLRRIQKKTQSSPHFFLSLRPLEGAIECLKELEKLGHTIFIVSSPSVTSDTCHSDKSKWLMEHMGEKWARQLVLTKDKTIIFGNYLIDDKEEITGVCDNPAWKHIIFTQPYNLQQSHERRLNKWDMNELLTLLQ
jgi:5'-nucleotidase